MMTYEHFQQLPFSGGEPHVAAVPDHALVGEIDGEVGGDDDRLVRRPRRPPDGGAQPGEQLVHPERLGDVVVRTRVEGGHLLALLAPGRQHDDGRGGPAADSPDDLRAVHIRQAEIEYQHVRAVPGHRGEARCAVRGGTDLVAARGQVDLQRPQDRRLVVDHQHAGHDSAATAELAERLATGSVTRIVRPPPSVSVAVTEPPIVSTKPLTTARPRPTPVPVLRAVSRSNGSNIRGFSSSGTPRPWSTTSRTTLWPSCLAYRAGGRPGGE